MDGDKVPVHVPVVARCDGDGFLTPPALQHRSRIYAGGALLADLTSCCPLSPPALAGFILCRWPAGLLSGDVSSHRYLHFYTPFLLCYFFPPHLIF